MNAVVTLAELRPMIATVTPLAMRAILAMPDPVCAYTAVQNAVEAGKHTIVLMRSGGAAVGLLRAETLNGVTTISKESEHLSGRAVLTVIRRKQKAVPASAAA